MKKLILAVVVLLVTTGATIGYFQWNKKELNVEKAEGIKVSALALYDSFSKDSLAAKTKFIDKVLEVNGDVNTVSKNQQGQTVVQIKTSSDGAYVNCTLEASGENHIVKGGDKISIKGICKGMGEGDIDLGILGDVYLNRCHIIK